MLSLAADPMCSSQDEGTSSNQAADPPILPPPGEHVVMAGGAGSCAAGGRAGEEWERQAGPRMKRDLWLEQESISLGVLQGAKINLVQIRLPDQNNPTAAAGG